MTTPARQLTYTYDLRGRATAVSAPGSSNPLFASNLTYAAHGEPSSLQLGNGLWETTTFTNELQVQTQSLGSTKGGNDQWKITNDYGTTTNNGNLHSQQINPNPTTALTDYFQYDGANRLLIASENPTSSTNLVCPDTGSQWCQQYSYDPFGNRTVPHQGNTSGDSRNEDTAWNVASISTATNRNLPGTTWGYDNDGNTTKDAAGNTYQYDAESRQSEFCPAGVCGVSYGYDGDGRRVTRTAANGLVTVFVYGADGELALEYSGAPAGSTGRQYLTADQLGSTRVVTSDSAAVTERDDYAPFGAFLPTAGVRAGIAGYGVDAGDRLKFTGKEWDAETGLDYFGARYFSGAQGRWTTVDPAFESEYLGDPQTWNRYSYVYNRPLTLWDPDGRCPQCLPALGVGAAGALVAGGATAFAEWYRTGDFNWRDVGAAVAGGFISGFSATATLGLSALAEAGVGTAVVVGAGSNVVGGVVQRSLDSPDAATDSFDPTAMGVDALMGGAGSAIGELSGQLVRRDFSPLHPPISKWHTSPTAYRRAVQTFQAQQATVNRTSRAVNVGLGTVISNGFWTIVNAMVGPPPPSAKPRPKKAKVESVFRPCATGDPCGKQ